MHSSEKGSGSAKEKKGWKSSEPSKDPIFTFSKNPQKKKLKVSGSIDPPHGNFLNSNIIFIEPISFAYPSNFLDTSG